jgi:hypothetical protein
VASKHDAKRARENFWVTQQNLAKQKGGRTGYTFKEKRAPAPKSRKGVAAPARPASPSTEAATGAEDANVVREEAAGPSSVKDEP